MKHPHIPLLCLSCAIIAVSSMLAGCAQTVNTHGQVILSSHLAAIQPGTSTREDVRQQLGTPSTSGTFSNDRWYYISSVTRDKVLEPNLLQKRQVIIVDFDQSGVVTKLSQKTEADAKSIEPVAAVTATHGESMGFLEQMFGNLGAGLPSSSPKGSANRN